LPVRVRLRAPDTGPAPAMRGDRLSMRRIANALFTARMQHRNSLWDLANQQRDGARCDGIASGKIGGRYCDATRARADRVRTTRSSVDRTVPPASMRYRCPRCAHGRPRRVRRDTSPSPAPARRHLHGNCRWRCTLTATPCRRARCPAGPQPGA